MAAGGQTTAAPAVDAGTRTGYRTCPLCEATCGLQVTLTDGTVTAVRGDREDVFSHGFICPKGTALTHLDTDPDRLRLPLIRTGTGWREASWEDAFAAVEAGLLPVLERHGDEALGFYLGNPNVHTMAGALFVGPLVKARRTRNIFSASTVDQMPKHVSSGYLFGHPLTIPVPDLDRTDHLLMLGANPYESNGSLCTAPDFPGRLKALRRRGGRLVVVDPRRTRTADAADEHVPVRPGTDAYLLFGLVHTLFDEDLVAPGRLADHLTGMDEVRAAAAGFAPETVAGVCGVPAATVRRLARELAAAPTAAVYGRIGTNTVEFGTLTSWLVDVLNALTGNLDRPGGAMFPEPAHKPAPLLGEPGSRTRRGYRTGRWHSRVRGLPEVNGELPAAALAEEIATPGEGRIRAFVSVAGNPVLSTPAGAALDEALAGLEFMVSVDPYVNETTRHAHVILPPPPLVQRGHYDFAFNALAVRNVANYSPPLVAPDPGTPSESEIMLRLALILGGQGAAGRDGVEALAEWLLDAEMRHTLPDRDPAELRPLLSGDTAEERVLDFRLRAGAYGDGFGERPDGLSLARLLDHPHGVDLGPLTPQLPQALRTPSGRVELARPELLADVPRLRAGMADRRDGLLLVGRRHLRSNNSWMHNVPALAGGTNRCTLQLHPDDATERGLADGSTATVSSVTGELKVEVEVTDRVSPGVVSLPHGWGHDLPGARLSVAAARPGVNTNLLSDPGAVDPLSGNAVLSGIPVQVRPA